MKIQVDGLPDGANPILKLQLSNPIEEATLSEIFDPLNSAPVTEGSSVVFKGVETTLATLVVSAKDSDIPLGSSVPHDLAPLCVLDAMDIKDEYVTELQIAIVSESETVAVAEEEKAEVTEAEAVEGKEDSDSKEGKETAEVTAEAVAVVPTCTVRVRVTYKPSPKDQREELYELLNKTSRRKAASLENLRKISMTMTRATTGSSPQKESSTTLAKPSVRPGFLNKKKKEPAGIQLLYERTFGPNSLLRKGWGVIHMGKNYIIFFGAISFFHFKGQMLALPPPV